MFKAMSRAAMMVVRTARVFFLSKIIPRMPNIKAAGTENIMASLPKAAIGLPQPPPQSMRRIITAGMTARKPAEILPKRIGLFSTVIMIHSS